MTREEAIAFLKQVENILLHSNSWLESTHNPIKESFDMAIASLTSKRAGIWVVKQDEKGKTYGECSRCGMKNYAGATMYCPDCGAFMGGKFEEEK